MMAQDQEHQPWDTQVMVMGGVIIVMVMAGLIPVLGHYPPCTTKAGQTRFCCLILLLGRGESL